MRSSLKQKRHRLRQLNSRTPPNHHTVRSIMTAFNGVFLCFLGNRPSAIPMHLAHFNIRLNVAFFPISHAIQSFLFTHSLLGFNSYVWRKTFFPFCLKFYARRRKLFPFCLKFYVRGKKLFPFCLKFYV